MQHIKEGEYSAKQLMVWLENEAKQANDYIDCVLNDYDHTPHFSEHFNNVLQVNNYTYARWPQGDLYKATYGQQGIYVFIVNADFQLSGKEVNDYCEKCNGAGFYVRGKKALLKGQRFYQGSTIRSLHCRIREHYSEYSSNSALQLNNPNRIIVKDKLTLFLFPVVPSLKRYPFFIRMIESEMHYRHKALTGNKRT